MITSLSAPTQWRLNPSTGSLPEWKRITKQLECVQTKPMQTSVSLGKGNGQEKPEAVDADRGGLPGRVDQHQGKTQPCGVSDLTNSWLCTKPCPGLLVDNSQAE